MEKRFGRVRGALGSRILSESEPPFRSGSPTRQPNVFDSVYGSLGTREPKKEIGIRTDPRNALKKAEEFGPPKKDVAYQVISRLFRLGNTPVVESVVYMSKDFVEK